MFLLSSTTSAFCLVCVEIVALATVDDCCNCGCSELSDSVLTCSVPAGVFKLKVITFSFPDEPSPVLVFWDESETGHCDNC